MTHRQKRARIATFSGRQEEGKEGGGRLARFLLPRRFGAAGKATETLRHVMDSSLSNAVGTIPEEDGVYTRSAKRFSTSSTMRINHPGSLLSI